jgi:hypothetical protein
MNYLPGLVLNLSPPDLSLPSSYDYRREPSAPNQKDISNFHHALPAYNSLVGPKEEIGMRSQFFT